MMPPASLTALMPTDAVRARAGQDDGEVVAVLRGERAEEKIDRRALPARLVEFGDGEMLIGDEKLPVGRNDVDMSRLERDAAVDLGDRHPGPRREDGRQFALVRRIEMDDDDESRVDLVGQAFEERLQGADAAGRGPNADCREPLDFAAFHLRGRGGSFVVHCSVLKETQPAALDSA